MPCVAPSIRLALLPVCLLSLLASGALAEPPPPDLARQIAEARAVERGLVETIRRVERFTVGVLNKEPLRVGGQEVGPSPLALGGVGSGVLVSRGGLWVLTNLHVVRRAGHLEVVTHDGARHAVRIRASDPDVDLAVLEFLRPPAALDGVRRFGEARADMAPGTWVLATGNPFFLGLDGRAAATLGVVSGVRYPQASGYVGVPVIQHDAEINPGSSGGPLWNLAGELIGINGTIATRARSQGSGPAYTGASFSVPVSEARKLFDRLSSPTPAASPAPTPVSAPPVVVTSTGFLGIYYRTQRDRAGRPVGAEVTIVDAQSPAAPAPGRGGLQPGDVIQRVTAGGRTTFVRTAWEFKRALGTSPPGTSVQISFRRNGHVYAWSGQLAGR